MFAKVCPWQNILQCNECQTSEFLQKAELRHTCRNTHNGTLIVSFAIEYCTKMLQRGLLIILAGRKLFLKILTEKLSDVWYIDTSELNCYVSHNI